jgi:hypothetical protein
VLPFRQCNKCDTSGTTSRSRSEALGPQSFLRLPKAVEDLRFNDNRPGLREDLEVKFSVAIDVDNIYRALKPVLEPLLEVCTRTRINPNSRDDEFKQLAIDILNLTRLGFAAHQCQATTDLV